MVYEPAVHSEHQVQTLQIEEPGAACDDGLHDEHVVAPMEPTKVFSEQRVHPAAPGEAENEPAPQKKHVGK